MPTIEFEVKTSAPTYGIKINGEGVHLDDGKGWVKLPSGKYELLWYIIGPSGSSFALIGKDGLREVVAVKERKIPPLESKTGDYADFEV